MERFSFAGRSRSFGAHHGAQLVSFVLFLLSIIMVEPSNTSRTTRRRAEILARPGETIWLYEECTARLRSGAISPDAISCYEAHEFECLQLPDGVASYSQGDVVRFCSHCTQWASDIGLNPMLKGKKQSSSARYYHCETLWQRAGRRTAEKTSEVTTPRSPCNPPTPKRRSYLNGYTKSSLKAADAVIEKYYVQKELNETVAKMQSLECELATKKDEFSVHDKKLAEAKSAHDQKLAEAKSAHEKNLADANAENDTLRKRCEMLACQAETVTVELSKMKSELARSIDDVHQLSELNVRLQQTALKANEFISPHISDPKALEGYCRLRYANIRLHDKKVSNLLDVIENPMFLGGAGRRVLYERSATIGKEALCPLHDPVEVARAMDLNGFALNHRGLNVLRRIGLQQNSTPLNGGWVASARKVGDAIKNVEEVAQKEIPFYKIPGRVDGVAFDYPKLFDFVLKLFKLDDLACNEGGVNISMTLDAADLSRNITQITAGIKVTDPRATDPETGVKVGMKKGSATVQSREMCIPFKIVISKDGKDAYTTQFQDFFQFFEVLEKNADVYGYKTFNIASPQDGSSVWKTMKRGGACKVHTHFCAYCACTSAQVVDRRPKPCKRCVDNGVTICYHWPVGDENTLFRIQQELEDQRNTPGCAAMFERVDSVLEKLTTRYEPGQVTKYMDPTNVEYDPKNSREWANFLDNYVVPDLIALGLDSDNGTPDVLRERLQTALEHIAWRSALVEMESACAYPEALAQIYQCVPCIMHLENRCGEKIIKMLLVEGFNERETEADVDRLVKQVERIVNTQILGSPLRPTNWRLIESKDRSGKKVVGDQTMPNRHVRLFIHSLDKLVDVCLDVDSDERALKWKECVAIYRDMIKVLRQKEDYTKEEIANWQQDADTFFLLWMDLHGRDGLTNYFHMIGAGHIEYFMYRYRNLYRYSQQGWESLNALIKSFFFRRTQRGGYAGKKGVPNSRVVPIARFFQRRLYWQSGKPVCSPVYSNEIV